MRTLLAVFLLLSVGCRGLPEPPPDAFELSRDVFVQPVVPGAWRHVSYRRFPTGMFPSNGLVVRTSEGALVVDTAWNPAQTAKILDWAERQVGPVAAVLITHAHDDRLGGIEAVHERGIESVALSLTAELARRDGWPAPTRIVPSGFSLEPYGIAGEFFFPGAGHSPDNAVVYFEDAAVLAGTCMIRSERAETLGNLGDANVTSWPDAVRAIRDRYPRVEVVVPGHGPLGNAQLLVHTLRLLEAERP
ncbi:MAG: subclass B1 metallo-beta-lactamase [Proteobacteria bacterium]|nr:subclass B1 metallo-beta-lactamase [Pseudomonadota bacterium]